MACFGTVSREAESHSIILPLILRRFLWQTLRHILRRIVRWILQRTLENFLDGLYRFQANKLFTSNTICYVKKIDLVVQSNLPDGHPIRRTPL